MKSFLVMASLLIALSIGCTYKSAGSQPVGGANIQAQDSSNANSTQIQQQPRCTLSLAGAPVINGVRLGMTADEVLALFPGSKDDPEVRATLSRPASSVGTTNLVLHPANYGPKNNQQLKPGDVSQITLNLLDGHVSMVTFGYNGPEFSHVDKLIEKVVKENNLPAPDQWEPYVGMDSQLKTLTCAEFEVRVFIGGQGGNLNYVLVKDLQAEKKLQDRRAKARAKAAATASPTP